jgi:hypothetical protein
MKKLIVLAILSISLNPFTVANAFWSYLSYQDHQDITKKALTTSLDPTTGKAPFCFSKDQSQCYFFNVATAVAQINKRHKEQDKPANYNPVNHFDSNELTGSLNQIAINRDKLNMLLSNTVSGFPLTASATQAEMWKLLGNMLHAVEDFYAHSTWVDSGNSLIVNFGVLTDANTLNLKYFAAPPSGETFCPQSGYPLLSEPINPISGYYFEQIFKIQTPKGECIHGATIAFSTADLVGVCLAGGVVPGISHDVGCTGNALPYSPANTLQLHQVAYKLAMQEAQSFVQSIVGDLVASNNVLGFCALLDLPANTPMCVGGSSFYTGNALNLPFGYCGPNKNVACPLAGPVNILVTFNQSVPATFSGAVTCSTTDSNGNPVNHYVTQITSATGALSFSYSLDTETYDDFLTNCGGPGGRAVYLVFTNGLITSWDIMQISPDGSIEIETYNELGIADDYVTVSDPTTGLFIAGGENYSAGTWSAVSK